MIAIDQATKDALQAPVKQIKATISWQVDEQTTEEITSDDRIISIKKEAEGYYLASTLRKVIITTAGTDFDALLDTFATITIQVKTGADTWGELSWGGFSISEMVRDEAKGTTTFTGYGGVARLQGREYNGDELSFPTTVAELAQELASFNFLTLTTDMTTLPNHDAPIPEDLWATINGTTYRDILEEIAGATGTLARVSGDGTELEFVQPPVADADDTLTEDNLITFKIGDSWGAVNAVVLSRQPQGDNVEVVDESAAENGRVDLVIANNEILDKQRQATAQPLLDATLGWEYRQAEFKTEGHGYHEVGDRLDITVLGTTYKTIITKSVVTVDGGIKEQLTSKIPEKIAIDYAKTGGISKTIYNTSLAVDKQHQEIEAIVSRQDAMDAETAEAFTQVLQTINSITATVQISGGGNLIKNSVGYGKTADGTLTIWHYAAGSDNTNVISQSSLASLNAGANSGYEIDLMDGATISQTINLTAGEEYNLSVRALKEIAGSATITINDGVTEHVLEFEDQQAYSWRQKDLSFTPDTGSITVTLSAGAGSTVAFTDLMLAQGGKTGWRQASGEIYNAQVSLDTDGVQVRSTAYDGDYVEITPLEFAGYSTVSGSVTKVFSLNRDITEVEKLKARKEITMKPIKIVPIDNSNYAGWAFVKTDN